MTKNNEEPTAEDYAKELRVYEKTCAVMKSTDFFMFCVERDICPTFNDINRAVRLFGDKIE
jgi:hypothetical protein